MFLKMKATPIYFAIILLYQSCQCGNTQPNKIEISKSIDAEAFNKKWYAGTAEVTTFNLQQARYGEVHSGTATMIFVTEDFSKTKQVKLDNPQQAGMDAVKVLKLNFARKFNTGIYPYSTFTSVFTPVNGDATIKVSNSVQEWCGHVYQQINRNKTAGFDVKEFSYFESEGDKVYMLDNAILEDEIWNMIRLNPTKLPIGNHKIIPSMLSSRFGHFPLQAEDATLTLMQNISENDTTYIYTVSYKNIERVLKIFFTATFPFELQGWEEIIKDSNGKPNKTTATATHSMQLDYWTKNKNEFRTLRKQLGLPEDF